MNEWPDMRLLREYAGNGNEKAFELLVSRHLALVYYGALRKTGQAQLAEEITQTVFTLLARKAGRIPERTLLSGWLFNTTRFVSMRAARDEMRRQRRQAELASMSPKEILPESAGKVDELLPLLDELLEGLAQRDREAILARYFDGKSFGDVAAATGVSEEAARKRVQRALGKMREMLVARGIQVGAASVAVALETARGAGVPASLSAALVSSAALEGASGIGAVTALTQSTLELMKWTRIKVVGASALALALAIGTAGYLLSHERGVAGRNAPPLANQPAPSPLASLEASAEQLRQENGKLSAALIEANLKRNQLVQAQEAASRLARQSRTSVAQNLASTNETVSLRDAFVSLGKMLRLSAVNVADLPPAEQKAAREEANQEALRLLQIQASGKIDLTRMDDYSPASPEEFAELTTGMLHGIVELTPEQVAQVQDALANYERQALQEKPQEKLKWPEPDTIGPLLGKIDGLLTAQQRKVLQQVMKKVNEPGGSQGPSGSEDGSKP